MFQNRLACATGLLLLPLALPLTSFGQVKPPCSFKVSPTFVVIPSNGGTGSFSVTPSDASCSWNVFNGTLGPVSVNVLSGTGPGNVTYTVNGITQQNSATEQQFILVGNVPQNQFEPFFLGGTTGDPSTLGVVTILRNGQTASSLRVTTTQLTVVNEQAYSATLTATGGTPPYTWQTHGVPYKGVQLSPTGLLSSNGVQVKFTTTIPENQLPQLSIFTPGVTDSAGNSVIAQLPAFLVDSPCAGFGGDTDGDGLCDEWETNGLDVTTLSGTTVHLDLPAMGANPMHKDIFVQTDYMTLQDFCLSLIGCLPGHNHKPKLDAISDVINAFANAPVNNPDGTTGINIHIDCGSDCVMIRMPGSPPVDVLWGAFSEAHSLSHSNSLGSKSFSGAYQWGEFNNLKIANFTSTGRNQVFHYSIFAHDLGGLAGISGISRNTPTSDFIVSLGSWMESIGSPEQQSGTFMHELGHNLGLHHGGYEDVPNYKPNYLSIMNYFFQMSALISVGPNLDYSRFQLPTLNQKMLNENVGLNGASVEDGTIYGTRYFCPNVTETFVVDGNNPIDWNCDGSFESLVAAPISNCGNSSLGCSATFLPPLNGFNDWNNLIYVGGSIGQLGEADLPTDTSPVQEMTPAIDSQLTRPLNVTVAGSGSIQLLPNSTIYFPVTVTNNGSQTDTYTLSNTSTANWADFSGIPASLTLNPGDSKSFNIRLSVPGSTSAGTGANFTVAATSQTNKFIYGSILFEVVVAGGQSALSSSIFSVTPGSPSVVAIQITNAGPGPALNAIISGITARTLGGSGTVSVADAFPIALGNLAVGVGGTVTVNVPVNIPSSVTRFSLTENGTVQDSRGATSNFSIGELVQP